MKKMSRRFLLLAIGLLVVFVFIRQVGPGYAGFGEGESAVAQAWRLAQENGRYQYATTLVQTTRPLLRLENAGRSATSDHLYIEGQFDGDAETMQMKIWSQGGNTLLGQGAIELKVEEGRAFGRAGSGEWEAIEGDISNLFAPGRDPLGFLAAASNVRPLTGADSAGGESTAEGTPTHLTTYTFDLDGPAFARFMREQLEAELQQRGELPPGLRLDVPRVYQEMEGTGEIWLDSTTGLPARLIIRATFPPAEYDQADVFITTDFSNWVAPSPIVTGAASFTNQITASLAAVDASRLSALLLTSLTWGCWRPLFFSTAGRAGSTMPWRFPLSSSWLFRRCWSPTTSQLIRSGKQNARPG